MYLTPFGLGVLLTSWASGAREPELLFGGQAAASSAPAARQPPIQAHRRMLVPQLLVQHQLPTSTTNVTYWTKVTTTTSVFPTKTIFSINRQHSTTAIDLCQRLRQHLILTCAYLGSHGIASSKKGTPQSCVCCGGRICCHHLLCAGGAGVSGARRVGVTTITCVWFN